MTLSRRAALAAAAALPFVPRSLWAGEDGTLMRGNRYEPATLDPHKVNTTYELAIAGDLFEGLVTFDAEGQAKPGLAASWSTSPDGKRYTFRLREGLTWSDGVPLTADDVVYSFRRLLDPATAGVFAALLYIVRGARLVNAGNAPAADLGVSAPDPLTVIIELDAPAPYLPQILANAYCAAVPRHVIAAAGDNWTRPGTLVSSGAYTLESWRPHESVVLVRNGRYHDGANVRVARVVYVPTEDLTSAVARFRSGELDMQLDVPLSQVERLRSELPLETRLSPTLITYYLAINTTQPKFGDGRVRRALSLAIDRDVLTQKVLRGGEVPAASFVSPMVSGYKPPQMEFAEAGVDVRLAEARKLLTEAGFADVPLSVTYSHSSSLDLRRIAVVIAGMWKRIGVQTTLFNTEGKVHFANMRQGNFDVAFAGWQADYNDPLGFLYVLDSNTVRSNYARYRNLAYDGLLAKAAGMENAGVRAGLLREAEALVMRDQPIIPLYHGVTKNLVSRRVVGWRANAVDVHLSRYLSLAS